MKKLGFVFIVALVAALLVPSGTSSTAQHRAQHVEKYIWNSSWVADNNPIIALKYLGAQAYASVDVATNDFEFFSGSSTGPTTVTAGDEIDGSDVGSNTGAICDSGSTEDSVLDVAEAECDTYAEFVNVINASDLWMAELVGALPADTVAAADFIDPGSADVKGLGTATAGNFYGLVADDSGFDEIVLLMSPLSGDGDVDNDDPSHFFRQDNATKNNVCAGKQIFITYISAEANVTGTSTITIYSYDMVDLSTRIIHVETLADATLTSFDYSRAPIGGAADECLFVRVAGGTLVTGTIAASGFVVNLEGN